jgi:cytochrome oxidase Cu insertion factor (SCO1/SenC/PrrC family)
MTSFTLRRALLAFLLALIALGMLAPAARADGDPGSDVLVYQNLFVAADANVSIPQQVELGKLLSAADKDGFQVRVAIIARPADLGAITALWGKPASYARFLGIELSLAYAQRLIVVMPDGFGFDWQGHSSAGEYRVLSKIPIGGDGTGLATTAEAAVRALAAASGIRIAAPVPASAPSANKASGVHPAPTSPGPLVLLVAAGAIALAGLGGWLARRSGAGLRTRLRSPTWRRPRRLSVPVAWLASGFVSLMSVLIVGYAIAQPPGGTAQASMTGGSALAANPNLDPGEALSGAAPEFTLTDQFGQPVSLSSYRGKVVVLAFNDSECTTVCPLTTTALIDAKAMLGPAASQVQLLGIDANPKATAIEDVLSYCQLHGMLYQWRYLTGSLAQLQRTWHAYSIGVDISQGQVDHEPAIFVISPQGRLARLYLTQLAYSSIAQLGQLLAEEVASLLPGHPAVRSHLSYAEVGGIGPATAVALPDAGGGYIGLGPGQPRLYLFFATWDQEVTSLAGQLDVLNAYQAATGRSGLPPLTAIDEASVEPSATALPGFLATLGQPLYYPVAVDDSGQVADGYGVQGEPWFVLTSATGKVIWSWQVSVSGWLSPASLETHLQAALGSAAVIPRGTHHAHI